MENLNSKRLLSMKEAQFYTGLKRAKCREFLERIDAIIHFGSRVLADRETIDKALDGRAMNHLEVVK